MSEERKKRVRWLLGHVLHISQKYFIYQYRWGIRDMAEGRMTTGSEGSPRQGEGFSSPEASVLDSARLGLMPCHISAWGQTQETQGHGHLWPDVNQDCLFHVTYP
jgi:hypothetical protein